MAKKAQSHNASAAKKKKRKAQSVAPKERTQEQAMMLGSVQLPVLFQVTLTNQGAFNELVIEWGCLGLSEEPDSIQEVTSNPVLDKNKPITTSEEGLHLYFDPPLTGAGVYGFKILCSYNEAVEPRSQAPEAPEPDEPTKEQIEGERVTGG
jgi:hypothetical protein